MKKPVLISLVCLLGAMALLVWGFGEQQPDPAPAQSHYVLLIENDTGTFLMQLRKGMQEAAAMQGARLTVQAAFGDPRAQAAELAKSDTTAALLLLSDPTPMLAALSEVGIPALLVGATLRAQVCVITDDAKAGAELMQRALLMAEPTRILLVTDGEDARARERTLGAAELSKQNGIQTFAWMEGKPLPQGFDCFVAMGSRVTQALASAKESGALPMDALLLGVDTGDNRAKDLESGCVSALVMDNPYAMGFVAIEKARQLSQGLLVPSLHTCVPVLIEPQNMYLSENVKMVFPLLQ